MLPISLQSVKYPCCLGSTSTQYGRVLGRSLALSRDFDAQGRLGEPMTDTVLSPQVYQENLDFWTKAWNMVKTPYTQMPDLAYVPRIPASIEALKSDPVLDLGCGSGWLSVFLCRTGFKVTGVDVAEHALELGRMWAKQEDLQIEFLVQDISKLNFAEAYFGSVVANSIFEHLTYELCENTAKSIYRILKPGGLLVACFDKVGTGPGEYYKLDDGTQVYTDKGRRGMMLRCFSDDEIKVLFKDFEILELTQVTDLTRFFIARKN